MNITHRLVPGLLAGALLVGGASSAVAAHSKAKTQRAFAYGQVSNLTATGFTLTRSVTKAGSTAAPIVVQVTVSGTTKERARKGTTGALSNGEYAFAVGAKGATGISANRVLYSATAFNARRLILRLKVQRLVQSLLHRHVAAGTVSATSPTSISITTAKGKMLTFAITSHTTYRVNKQLATAAPVFTQGEKVRVLFARDAATKSLTARVIIVTPTNAA